MFLRGVVRNLAIAIALSAGSAANAQDCNGCLIECNTRAVSSGNCEYEAEVICDEDWTGSICFDCDASGYTFASTLASSDGTTCELPSTPSNTPLFTASCEDLAGAEVSIKVELPSDGPPPKSKGGKGKKSTGKSSSIETQMCTITSTPTLSPTRSPTKSPTRSPTRSPTKSPTRSPTRSPTKNPTDSVTFTPGGCSSTDVNNNSIPGTCSTCAGDFGGTTIYATGSDSTCYFCYCETGSLDDQCDVCNS